MHERTQRAIARLMFVFCCAVPTAITMSCVLVSWTPWYHQKSLRTIEARLSTDSGLVVEIDDFARAAPSTMHLYGVRLLDPETNREVAAVRELQWISESNETSILLHQPKLQSRELDSAWQLVHDRFLCRPEYTSKPVLIAANDLTIQSHTGDLTLRDVDAWIRPRETSIEASIQCLPANSRTESPINITVRRDRGGEAPATHWLLETSGTPLPCSALAEYFPLMESLGSDAMFSGTMRWQLQGDQWWIDLGGSNFEDVSLDRVFEHQAHRFTGTAKIHLERCRIEPHNRRSDIAGSIRAKDGLIGRSLLFSANQHLGFVVQLPNGMIDGVDDIPYDRFAIGFQVNSTQLTLDGICRTEEGYESYPAGVVLCLNRYPLVQSSGQTLDSVRVISAIAPAHSVPVLTSRQTSGLTNVFIPPSRSLPRDELLSPVIRSAERWQGGPTIPQPTSPSRIE
jgi:hypothetical protein